MIEPKQITRKEADKIIAENMKTDGPRRQVVVVYKHDWYDVRGMSPAEVMQFVEKLVGQKIKPEQIINLKT